MTAPSSLAIYLSSKTAVIAGREDAGVCFSEVRNLIDDIGACINRPRPKRYCGNCPTLQDNEQRCATPLFAPSHDAVEVECWRCHRTYIIEDLIQCSLDNARGLLYSEREVLDIMAQIGRHIPRGTWWWWKDQGRIQSKNEWGAEPRYLLEDVQDAYEHSPLGKRHAA